MQSAIYPVIEDLLNGPMGPVVAFVWGAAEALFWPIVPDYFGVAALPTSPGQWIRVATWLTLGSIFGGSIGYWFARLRKSDQPLSSMPMVTEPMIRKADGWLESSGPLGIMRQPLSGVPYKVFVFLSGARGLPFWQYLAVSLVARGARIYATSAVASAGARMAGPDLVQRYYDPFLVVFTLVFALGLWKVASTR